jgi:multiple antibiotic resistance protein
LNIKKKDKNIHAFWASFVALVILILFLFTGEGILKLFSVDIRSFAVAGSLIIFIFAIEMILDIEISGTRGQRAVRRLFPWLSRW